MNSIPILTPSVGRGEFPEKKADSTFDIADRSNIQLVTISGSSLPKSELETKKEMIEPAAASRRDEIAYRRHYKRFTELFRAFSRELFEDGVETEFSRELIGTIEQFGETAIEALTDLIIGEKVPPGVSAEALRWIGWMNQAVTKHSRLVLLLRCLRSDKAIVRDGALIGLSYLDDPAAIPFLNEHLGHETVSLLVKTATLVLEQLIETQAERQA